MGEYNWINGNLDYQLNANPESFFIILMFGVDLRGLIFFIFSHELLRLATRPQIDALNGFVVIADCLVYL